MKNHSDIVIIAGPTASGKSNLAFNLASKYNGFIINCDSVQLYTDIPILSAQPSLEIQSKIPHSLYGIFAANEVSSVGKYIELLKKIIYENKKYLPIIVGGTGMYLKAIIEGLSQIPDIEDNIRNDIRSLFSELGSAEFYKWYVTTSLDKSNKIDVTNPQRLMRAAEIFIATGKTISYWQNIKPIKYFEKYNIQKFLLFPNREKLYKKCEIRFKTMIKDGAIEEVKNLLKLNYNEHITKAIGIREIVSYLKNETSLENAQNLAILNTKRYAKRQYTWFRHQFQNANKIYFDEKIKLEDINSNLY